MNRLAARIVSCSEPKSNAATMNKCLNTQQRREGQGFDRTMLQVGLHTPRSSALGWTKNVTGITEV